MAVVVSIARGHDAAYPFKTMGAGEGPDITGQRGAGYYLSATEKGGEPAGTWVGDGAAELGFKDGDTVRREGFEPLYGHFLDPRDPSGRTYLGRPPRVNAGLAAIYQSKLAVHPGATADERMRLLAEARAAYEGRWVCSISTPRSAWTRRSRWPTHPRWRRPPKPSSTEISRQRRVGGPGRRDLGRGRDVGPPVCRAHSA
jgi:hypothetical protein